MVDRPELTRKDLWARTLLSELAVAHVRTGRTNQTFVS